jgi:hypothetical protein
VESCANPAAIRNSTLLLPAISQNLPCNTRNLSLLLVVARTSSKLWKPLEDLQEIGLALPAFCENLPANRKLQGRSGRETVLLLTASSATQSVSRHPKNPSNSGTALEDASS